MATIKSIEEKAKRYDEVIEKLRSLHDDYDTVSTLIDIKEELEHIFPELKESEDERIRNRIINYLKLDLKEYPAREKRINEMLAYLEKQGKSNMGISEATKQELENNLNKALEKETPESWNKFLEKQGEQKPAWSEEDESWFKEIELMCLNFSNDTDYREKFFTWLKSIKEKVLPQPKQEWSKEDDGVLLESISVLQNNSHWVLADKLKSLKDRYTWKPSEGQMRALSNAGNSFRPFEEGHKVLWSLYNDLKKLREKDI